MQSEAGDGNDDTDVAFNGNTWSRPAPPRQGCRGFRTPQVFIFSSAAKSIFIPSVILTPAEKKSKRKHTVVQKISIVFRVVPVLCVVVFMFSYGKNINSTFQPLQ